MKTGMGLTLFGIFACGLNPASAGEFFHTLVPFESEAAAPVAGQPEHFLQTADQAPESPRQQPPQRLPAAQREPVQPASYCSDVRTAPRPAQNVCPPGRPQKPRRQPPCPPRKQPCPEIRRQPAEIRRQPAEPRSAPGVFTAPRATGEVSGPSRSVGIRGLSISFPAFRFELPTIQLPCLVRYRRNPEMHLDESVATYTTEEPVLYGQLMTRREVVQETPAVRRVEIEERAKPSVRSAPTQPCPTPRTECTTQADRLRQMLRRAQEPCPPDSPPENCPDTKPLSSSTSIEELNREYQARLQELIKQRERQIQNANRELELLKRQQKRLPKSSGQGDDTAPPNAPAPR